MKIREVIKPVAPVGVADAQSEALKQIEADVRKRKAIMRVTKASAATCGADEKSGPWVRRDVSPAFDVHRLGAFSQLAEHGSQQDDQK